MSHNGCPTYPTPTADSATIAIVASRWHDTVMNGLIKGACRALSESGAKWQVLRVPGSFELPLGVESALTTGSFDGAVALGVVIRGGTPHFDYVCQAATSGIMTVMLNTAKPVGFGLLTCDNDEQALDRAGLVDSKEDKGYEAAQACLAMLPTNFVVSSRRTD